MGGGKEREERGQGRGLVYVYFHYSLLLHFVNNSTLKYICTVWQDYRKISDVQEMREGAEGGDGTGSAMFARRLREVRRMTQRQTLGDRLTLMFLPMLTRHPIEYGGAAGDSRDGTVVEVVATVVGAYSGIQAGLGECARN